jgi:hypothetical protein
LNILLTTVREVDSFYWLLNQPIKYRINTDLVTTNKQEINPLIYRARVARLASADYKAKPHVITCSICIRYRKIRYTNWWKAQTKKNKKYGIKPAAALLIVNYNEDWNKLLFIKIWGMVALLVKKGGYIMKVNN